jgi:hypothetical protein
MISLRFDVMELSGRDWDKSGDRLSAGRLGACFGAGSKPFERLPTPSLTRRSFELFNRKS